MIATLLGWLASFLLFFSLSTLVLATFGWSLGVRRLYVRVLLKIFRVGGINFSILIFSFYLIRNVLRMVFFSIFVTYIDNDTVQDFKIEFCVLCTM